MFLFICAYYSKEFQPKSKFKVPLYTCTCILSGYSLFKRNLQLYELSGIHFFLNKSFIILFPGSFTHSVALCKLWTSLDLFICNNTCLHLAFAIMDAYLRLKEPLRHRGRGSPLRCSRITWLLSPWLISLVQASAQFMLSESDHPIVHDGLCFIYNNNFLIVGSIFSYGIPNAITVAFYSLCYKEIKALKAGRYFDENGSLRRQYTHHQHESDDNSSQSDDDVDDVDTCIADVINHGDDVNDIIEPQTPEKVPEIVQMDVVATKRRPVGNNLITTSQNGETSHFNNVTSFSNDHSSLQGATNGCLISSTGHTNRAFANSTMDDLYDIPEDTNQQTDQVSDPTNTSCTVLLETDPATNKTPLENKPPSQQIQLKNPDPEIQKCEADHVIMNQECPDECLRHELELSRVLFMLMLSVCLSWLPLSVGQFVYAVCPDCVRRLTMGQLLCLKWAGYMCGVWGPFIYVKGSEYVRCALRQLVTCQYCR